MKMKLLRVAVLAVTPVALSACSYLGAQFTNDKVQYESSNSRAPLEVPPDLSQVPHDNLYNVPQRTRDVSASSMQQGQQAAAANRTSAAQSTVLPETVTAKVMRDGDIRWVHTQVPAQQLWPVVQDFWASVGLTIKNQDPKTGYIETEWAENKARLPQDIIRATLGQLIDAVYSTGERDQYRCRLERNPDGSTDVYITHRSMVEVVKGNQGDQTVWQPGPRDPQLEAEMATKLAQKIESEFNPDLKKADLPSTKQAALEKTAGTAAAKAAAPVYKSEIVNGADGKAAAIIIKEPFDHAWRRTALAIDRMNFTVSDRDRTKGWFLVKYLDPTYEAEKKREQGFFTNLFSQTKTVEPPTYQIKLTDEGNQTRVTVLNANGGPDTTGVAPKILTLLGEQTR